jgi:hypothetical protein
MYKASKLGLNALAALVLTSGACGLARAEEPQWDQHHPRRADVNQRLENQDKRIHRDLKDGDLSKSQAAALHKDDRNIRQEERDMAHMDNGHITRLDQQALNQQENAVSKDIRSDAHATSQWDKNHPRRVEVNDRLASQNQRIHNEVRDGQITKAQAQTLHTDDRDIRQEERDMAHMDNGHITKLDQQTLNQQENVVSQEIGK